MQKRLRIVQDKNKISINLHVNLMRSFIFYRQFIVLWLFLREVKVGEAGIEPAWPYGQRILSPSCIPIPPLAHSGNFGGGTRIRTGEWKLCRLLPYHLAMPPF